MDRKARHVKLAEQWIPFDFSNHSYKGKVINLIIKMADLQTGQGRRKHGVVIIQINMTSKKRVICREQYLDH